jgi:hypothetical protein
MPFAAFLFVWVQCLAPWTSEVLRAEEDAVRTTGGVFQQSIAPYPLPLLVAVELGTTQARAVLDTGATDTILDLSLKGLTSGKLGTPNMVDADGINKPVEVFRGPDLTIQTFYRSTPHVVLADLGMLPRSLGVPVRMILGMSDVSAGILLIDRETHFAVLHHGQWRLHASTAKEIPLVKERRTPYLEAVFGGKPCQVLVDTGYSACISLEESIFEALVASGDIERTMRGSVGQAMFGGPKETKGKSGTFLKGEFMGKSLVGVSVSSTGGSNKLGLEWLHAFSIEIDFANRKMRYKYLPDAEAPVNIHRMLGAAIFFNNREPVVAHLKPEGGAAREAGIEVGDKVERLGEVPKEALTVVTIYQEIQKNAGKDLTIALRRGAGGETREVTVKLPKLMSPWSQMDLK